MGLIHILIFILSKKRKDLYLRNQWQLILSRLLMTAWFRFFFLIPYLERRQWFGLVSFVINEIPQPHPSLIYIKRIPSNSLQVPFSCLLLTDCTPLVLGQLVHDQENLYTLW